MEDMCSSGIQSSPITDSCSSATSASSGSAFLKDENNSVHFLVNGNMDHAICMNKVDTIDLQYQVAGHSRVGLLTDKSGAYVLKPVQKEPLGTREIEFYKRIFKNNKQEKTENCGSESSDDLNGLLSLFHKVLPRFHGLASISSEQKGIGDDSESTTKEEKYLILDNIVADFKKPSVVDLKIGAQTWGPDATQTKINTEMGKYLGTKRQLGISVTGMHYFDMVQNVPVRCKDGFGKALTTESIYTVLKQFLNHSTNNGQLYKLVTACILDKLQLIQQIFDKQTLYNFYSSSVLIAYDAEYLINILPKFNNNINLEETKLLELLKENSSKWLHVWMIDFAHVHSKQPQQRLDKTDDKNQQGDTISENTLKGLDASQSTPTTTGTGTRDEDVSADLDSNYLYGLNNVVKIFTNILNEENKA